MQWESKIFDASTSGVYFTFFVPAFKVLLFSHFCFKVMFMSCKTVPYTQKQQYCEKPIPVVLQLLSAIPVVLQLLSSHYTVASSTVRNLFTVHVKAASNSGMFLSYELHVQQ